MTISGVAQLSCTDCSACSGSSTASSDITDPGSPYSTSSSHGEDSTPGPLSSSATSTTITISRSPTTQQLIQTRKITQLTQQSESKVDNKMPPHESNCQSPPPPETTPSPKKQPWPWDVNKVPSKSQTIKNNNELERVSPSNLLKRATTATKNTHTNTKRLKTIAEKSSKQKTNDIKQLNISNNNTRKILGKSIATLCPILPKPAPFQNILCTSISPTLPTSNANPPRTHTAPSRCSANNNKNNFITQNTTLITTTNTINNPKVQSLRDGPITKIITKTQTRANGGVINSSEYVSNLLTGTPQQQGKITEYFKAQIKPPTINTMKKDIMKSTTSTLKPKTTKRIQKNNAVSNNKIELVKNQTAGDLKKYLGLLSGNFNGECDTPSELYRKIDVRTLSLHQNHIQAVKMDTKLNGKVNPVVSLTRKILPKQTTTPASSSTTQKKTQPDVPNKNGMKLATLRLQDVKTTLQKKNGVIKSTTTTLTTNSTTIMPTIVVPTNINTALPTVVTPKLVSTASTVSTLQCPPLVKLNGSFIPIVKLNPVPVKVNSNSNNCNSNNKAVIQSSTVVTETKVNNNLNNNNNLQCLRIETGCPTVVNPLLLKQKCSPNLNNLVSISVSETQATTFNNETTAHKQQLLSSPKSIVLETIQQKKSKALENNNTANELPCKTELNLSNHNNSNGVTPSSLLLDKNISLLQVSTTPSLLHNNNFQLSSSIESQKSPILSQPKTIRFPPRKIDTASEERRLDGKCQWSECHAKFETSGALLEHLQIAHVISQAAKENFVCLWVGCKVHGRTSCSRSWLERHVLSHAGNKPYRCIVDGCGCRFNSQTALERHVNSHFNADGAPNINNQRRSLENGGSNKLTRKNGKKIRYRLQPWSARMFDYFDAGIMEGLQHRLINMTDIRTAGKIAETAGNVVTLRSTVIARRTDLTGNKSVLLRWHPENVVPDEWLPESEATPFKHVPIPGLEPSAINVLHEELFSLKKNCSSSTLPDTSIEEQRPRNRRKQVTSAVKYMNRLVT
ncbi:probable serine/threonine-protein kinase nek3 isoform X2 [Chrysoperla carnea]|uniref:probable serine/threonine-protein kinase nek3 isoform X2 n=1 Tax=Chrysoperla carnea TaxID=189513 RepID=UPI001D080F40|nr:probable serine/threonine-protein kinase nek3 isoform X2 [Chrysoperla carnea]